MIRQRVAAGSLAMSRWKWANASSSVRVGPHDGKTMCPVTTSKLINQESVPCRIYSNSRESHMACLHGQVRMFALQRLHPSQLIRADGAFSSLGPFGGHRVELTPLDNFLLALRIWDGREKVSEAVRLEPPFFSSRAACRGEIWWTMPRAITSSAI